MVTKLRAHQIPDVAARTKTVHEHDASGGIGRPPFFEMNPEAVNVDKAHGAT